MRRFKEASIDKKMKPSLLKMQFEATGVSVEDEFVKSQGFMRNRDRSRTPTRKGVSRGRRVMSPLQDTILGSPRIRTFESSARSTFGSQKKSFPFGVSGQSFFPKGRGEEMASDGEELRVAKVV